MYQGSNNPYGIPAFATSYAHARLDLPHGVSLGISAENLLNYSSGNFHGQVIANQGFVVQGVRWDAKGTVNNQSYGCNCLINGSPFSTPNSAVVVQPRNIYFTLSKTFP